MERRRFLGLAGGSLIARFARSQSMIAGEETPTTNHTTDTSDRNDIADGIEGSDSGKIKAKVDLHAHLRRGGGQLMADRYAELGFDVLVGTDHHYDVNLPGDVYTERVEDYSDLDFSGPILNGVEASEDRHVNVIRSDNEMIKQINHPMRYGLDAEEIQTFGEQIGADLVEITNHANALEEYPTLTDVVQDLDLKPAVTSDAHDIDAVGQGYVIVEVSELTGDSVIMALKRGDYAIGGRLW